MEVEDAQETISDSLESSPVRLPSPSPPAMNDDSSEEETLINRAMERRRGQQRSMATTSSTIAFGTDKVAVANVLDLGRTVESKTVRPIPLSVNGVSFAFAVAEGESEGDGEVGRPA